MNIKKLYSSKQKRRREKIYWYEKRKQVRIKLAKFHEQQQREHKFAA